MSDAFVAKLGANGALLWNTFLGGSGNDDGNNIALDASGNVYVTGNSDATWGSPLRVRSGDYDAFVAKLDANGALLWNTFLGGSDTDSGSGLALDASGNIYVAGGSSATWGSPLRAFSGYKDAFVAKLDANGALLWNTFLGGSSWDFGSGLALDASGNIYVTGNSSATWGCPLHTHSGGGDVFVAQLDANGTLLWNSFLGGSSEDSGWGLALDASGNIYVTGDSSATWGSPLRAYSGGYDAFVAKLSVSNNGSATTAKPRSDFDGDGQADILWRNSATGENWLYLMDGPDILHSQPVNTVPDQNWKIAGVGDFDGDGQADILWRNSATGENWLYLMDGPDILESHPINTVANLNWKIAGVGDFDGDGQADILWRNSSTGENWLYRMNGASIIGSTPIPKVADLNWEIQGVYGKSLASLLSTYTLSVASSGACSVDIGSSTGHGGTTYYAKTGLAAGASVSLTAPPTSGTSLFDHWSGCDSATGAACTVLMTANKTVVANYTPTYSLTVKSTWASGVTISSSTGHGGVTDYTKSGLPSGTSVSLTAPPSAGIANFSSWSGCTSASGNTCTLSMTANKTVTANYIDPTAVIPDGTFIASYGPVEFDVAASKITRLKFTFSSCGTSGSVTSSSGGGLATITNTSFSYRMNLTGGSYVDISGSFTDANHANGTWYHYHGGTYCNSSSLWGATRQ